MLHRLCIITAQEGARMLLAKNRNYRLVFSASAISNLGDGVSALALPWLATLLTRAAMLVAVNASHMAGLTVLVLHAQEVLGLSAVGTGFLMTAGAVGGVLGGLLAPQICKRLGLRGSMIFGLIAFCVNYILFVLTG
ncbi:hypothetical protein [Pseudorhodobacter ferrugineus]|uniref:hypothetical protein n=1 Tax=Pseudorhodobacter ferrugineus TaxID=77008 RepID=UPI0004253D5D|nr:hypothetical protein [Pseudorhodobacter ferrugineus]